MAESYAKKQHTVEYVAISALVLVALVIGVSRFKKAGGDDEVFSRKEFNQKWKEVEILEASIPNKENEISYSIEDGNIPFKGPLDDTVEYSQESGDIITLPPEMQFQGMIWKSSRPQAIINNKVYDVKDVISVSGGEVEVKSVGKDGIHLIYKGKEFIARPK